MNIFILHRNKKICAQQHVDDHCKQSINEYAQMLATAYRHKNGVKETIYRRIVIKRNGVKIIKLSPRSIYVLPDDDIIVRRGLRIIKKLCIPSNAFEKHPCTVWVGESKANYEFLFEIYVHLCNEFFHRFSNIHFASNYATYLTHTPDLPDLGLTKYPKFSWSSLKSNSFSQVIEDYRQYYINEKSHIAKWTKRKKPSWFDNKVA